MQITNFSINTSRTAMNLTIIDAADVNSLKLFTDKTYKDYNQAVDLTGKLTGSSTENIVITLGDLNLAYFDGVYFIEAEDTDEISQAITEDLTKYEECILNKLLALEICEDCLKKQSPAIINAQVMLENLKVAIKNSFIDEVFIIVKMLNKYCSNDCKACGPYDDIVDNNYYSTPNISANLPFDLELNGLLTGTIITFEQSGEIVQTITTDSTSNYIITFDTSKSTIIRSVGTQSVAIVVNNDNIVAGQESIEDFYTYPIVYAEPLYSQIISNGFIGPNGYPLILITAAA